MDDTANPARGTPWAPFQAMRRWCRERRMVAALSALDDATLKDIGIYRGEIPSIARAHRAKAGRP